MNNVTNNTETTDNFIQKQQPTSSLLQQTEEDSIDFSAEERWRLLLGEAAHTSLAKGIVHHQQIEQMDRALSWLYGREKTDDLGYGSGKESLDRFSGDGASTLTTPDWINDIQKLFPKDTIERLEKDALERYQLADLVTNPQALERATPNLTLLTAVLQTKHLMNPDVLLMARKLVAQVVAELMAQLQQEVTNSFSGKRTPVTYKKTGSYAQFAIKETIRRNLKHYQPNTKQLLVKQPWFYLNEKTNPKKWQIIILVDQSASMAASVIHSAVMAACFWQLPNMNTHLIAFDTEVVDLTSDIQDPVELLMQVQLGGGTDIAHAMHYASDLIVDCKRSILVLVSDFFEGGNVQRLLQTIANLSAQGTHVLGLAALDKQANPVYCHETAKAMIAHGAKVAAMTPGELAHWLADIIKQRG